MRVRSIVIVGAAALVPLGLLATACADDGPGDTARFCTEVQAHSAELTANPETLDHVGPFLDLYRDIADVAPLQIEPHWQALILNYETATTVDMSDPASVQRAVAQAFATERSAVEVHDFLIERCNVDLGPVTTIVPHGAAPTPAGTGPVTTVPG